MVCWFQTVRSTATPSNLTELKYGSHSEPHVVSIFLDVKTSSAVRLTNAKYNRSLKDASKITFYHDADDDVPLPPSGMQPASSNAFYVLLNSRWQSASFVAGARCSGRPIKPSA
ncbi:hypothetical protein BDR05DRAFT_950735 [Suillus weaverae]|nr:hypothetical protein BDR05DRAFT_950735 [Suillus weaverae]